MKNYAYTPLHFGYYDGNIRTVLLMIGEWEDGSLCLVHSHIGQAPAAEIVSEGSVIMYVAMRHGPYRRLCFVQPGIFQKLVERDITLLAIG